METVCAANREQNSAIANVKITTRRRLKIIVRQALRIDMLNPTI